MNNEQQIVELAKKLRGHAWLARFRKADDKKNNYAHLSDQACNDIAGYVDDLLDLIDPPQPVGVDWGKAIQFEDGEEIEYISKLEPNKYGVTRCVLRTRDNEVFLRKEDGTSSQDVPYEFGHNIINTPDPAPIELGYEVAVARHIEGESCVAMHGAEGGVILFLKEGADWRHSQARCEETGWTFGPWHSRTVTH